MSKTSDPRWASLRQWLRTIAWFFLEVGVLIGIGLVVWMLLSVAL